MNARALALGLLLLTACPHPSIGNPCETGASPGTVPATTISSPALECEGRTCIQIGAGPSLCSAPCARQEDCDNIAPGADHLCAGGFTCAAVSSVGKDACAPFCVCRDNFEPPVCVP